MNDILTETRIKKLKEFNWQEIFSVALALDSFNGEQFRFLKGLFIEKSVSLHSNENLIYVGETHRDFVWENENISVELKSMASMKIYKKNGIKPKYNIKLNNSMGTNNKKELDQNNICDIIVFLFRDGVFALDKNSIMKNVIYAGDGFNVSGPTEELVPITNRIFEHDILLNENVFNFKTLLETMMHDAILSTKKIKNNNLEDFLNNAI